MERKINIKHTVHPNKYDGIVSLCSPSFEGSPLGLKPEGWSAISPGHKGGAGDLRELRPGPEAFCWVWGAAWPSPTVLTLGTF